MCSQASHNTLHNSSDDAALWRHGGPQGEGNRCGHFKGLCPVGGGGTLTLAQRPLRRIWKNLGIVKFMSDIKYIYKINRDASPSFKDLLEDAS